MTEEFQVYKYANYLIKEVNNCSLPSVRKTVEPHKHMPQTALLTDTRGACDNGSLPLPLWIVVHYFPID